MDTIAIRKMVGDALRTIVCGTSRTQRASITFMITFSLLGTQAVIAQMGPLDVNGYLEYQYRLGATGDNSNFSSQLGTFRTNVSTYLWRPWIMQLNASLGLTRTFRETDTALNSASLKQDGTLITGRIRADLFRQSRFPFSLYFNGQDSGVDGDLPGNDVLSTSYGFSQQFASTGGGRYSLDYRHITAENFFQDSFQQSRTDNTDVWKAQANKSFGRSQFKYETVLTDISREDLHQKLSRNGHTLQHRFSTTRNFFLEDTVFFSDENIELADTGSQRRFLQLNSVSTWRPKTKKPLLFVGRGLLQGSESGVNGVDQKSKNMVFTGSVTYQHTDRVLFGANAGVAASDSDASEDTTTTFQQIRASYRSLDHDIWGSRYRWGGSADAGNEAGREIASDQDSVQNIALRLNHRLSRQLEMGPGRQLEISIAQNLSSTADSDDSRSHALSHTVFGTLSHQGNKTTSYLRLTATDRRAGGDNKGIFQLVNMQASRNTQIARDRDWSGSVTMQYGRTVNAEPGTAAGDEKTVSYSADIRYHHRNLLDVSGLHFNSELRMRSSDFFSDDPFEEAALESSRERTDADWRNQLSYQVGLLQLRVEANMRQINSNWSGTLFLGVRRYYGFQ